MQRLLYTSLLWVALPFVALLMLWRGLRTPRYRVDLAQRLALTKETPGGAPIWVHGVSVGEVQAAAPLVRLLHRRDPQRPLLLTTATATGFERAQLLLGDLLRSPDGTQPALRLRYAPFDLPSVTRRFVHSHRPCAAIFMETELWPNLIATLAARSIPLALVSARVSVKSALRYQRFAARLMARTLSRIGLIAAQSEGDAERFLRLGAPPATLHVTGNIKFDLALPADIEVRGAALRKQFAPDRALWVAGSTHPGEEAQCLHAQRVLLQRCAAAGRPAPLLVLAPRHPERFDAVARWLEADGVPFVRRSMPFTVPADAAPAIEVLLLDTLGELTGFYAAADVVFVGGSLVPVGGHNLLEPAALGRATLTGPHSFNSPEAARLLESVTALTRVESGETLAEAVWSALLHPQQASDQGKRAAAAVAANRGTAARLLAVLEPMLPLRA